MRWQHRRWLSHHSSITLPLPPVLPSSLEQLQVSRKAAGGAGGEEGKGEGAMTTVRLLEEKQRLLVTQDLSLSLRLPNHWDFNPFRGAKNCDQ